MNKIMSFINEFATNIGNHTFISGESLPIYDISSYHTLFQYIGYAKFLNRYNANVYLRGQHTLYDSLMPAVYRKVSSLSGFTNRNERIAQYVNECAREIKFIGDLDRIVREPILQHYGIKSRWVDLVDNVWVAIWFGVYDWHTKIFGREYKNIVQRLPSNDSFVFIILVGTDGITEDSYVPGFYKGADLYTVDLRKAAPSIFLRPHAQHALLVRSKILNQLSDADISKNVVGIARLKLNDAITWIGLNGLISARSLFPPVNFDHGYGVLIEQAPFWKDFVEVYGSIYSVSY